MPRRPPPDRTWWRRPPSTRPARHLATRRVRRRVAGAVARAALYLALAVAGALVVNVSAGAGPAAPSAAGGPPAADVAPSSVDPESVGDGQPVPPAGGSGGEDAEPGAQPQPQAAPGAQPQQQPPPAPRDPQVVRIEAVMAEQQASANGHVAFRGWGGWGGGGDGPAAGLAATTVARITNTFGPVQPQTQAAANAVVSNIPGADRITLGGTRPNDIDPNAHVAGLAIDYMVMSDRALGDAIVAFHIAHWNQLRVYYIIYRQHILMSPNGAWQAMEDRGSPTANHMDHVHVSYQR